MVKRLNFILFVFISFLLTACSVQPISTDAAPYNIPSPELISTSQESPHYWWTARFKMIWQGEHNAIDFSSNLIIAHQIINPVLTSNNETIKLWRFHRRAANDSTGHQFSFIFYTTQENARKIYKEINTNPLTIQLIDEEIVEKISFDNLNKPKKPKIGDTSDKSWFREIQKSWPYYIMGVSILWLDMLNQQAAQENVDISSSIKSQQKQYRQINKEITAQWKSQGKHAFFHHISAIFGYEAIEVRY